MLTIVQECTEFFTMLDVQLCSLIVASQRESAGTIFVLYVRDGTRYRHPTLHPYGTENFSLKGTVVRLHICLFGRSIYGCKFCNCSDSDGLLDATKYSDGST